MFWPFLANDIFGQSIFGQSVFGQSVFGQCVLCCVVLCCVVLCCCAFSPPSADPPPPDRPLPDRPSLDRPKFRSFFHLPHHFRSFRLSHCVSSRGILVVFEVPGPSNVHVWALGLSCESGFGAAGASHDNPRTPNVHNWHRRFKHQQNSTRRPPEKDKKEQNGAGEGKKAQNFGPPPFGAPPFGAPTLLGRTDCETTKD